MSPIEDTVTTPVRVWPTALFGIPYGHNRPTPRCIAVEHDAFGNSFRAFVEREIAPRYPPWDKAPLVGRRLVSGD